MAGWEGALGAFAGCVLAAAAAAGEPEIRGRGRVAAELTREGEVVAVATLAGTCGYPDGALLSVRFGAAGPGGDLPEAPARVEGGAWRCESAPWVAVPSGTLRVQVVFDPARQPAAVLETLPEGPARALRTAEIGVAFDLEDLPLRCRLAEAAFPLSRLRFDAADDSILLTWRRPWEEEWREGAIRRDGERVVWRPPEDGLYELRFFSARAFDPTEKKRAPAGAPTSRTIRLLADEKGALGSVHAYGRRLLAEGNAAAAAAALRIAAEADPAAAEVAADLGQARLELRDFDGAQSALEASVRLDPQADAMFNLAVARLGLEDRAGAWKALKLALRWAGKGTRLLERCAALALDLSEQLDDPAGAWREIAEWAPETPAGAAAAKRLEGGR